MSTLLCRSKLRSIERQGMAPLSVLNLENLFKNKHLWFSSQTLIYNCKITCTFSILRYPPLVSKSFSKIDEYCKECERFQC